METGENILKTSEIIVKHPRNPILCKDDIPYPSTFVCNAGVAKWKGAYIMMFKNVHAKNPDDKNGNWNRVTGHGIAHSNDGVTWEVEDKPTLTMPAPENGLWHDPRITVIDDVAYITLAIWTEHGCLGAILRTNDFENYELINSTTPDNRNLVLFPEKITGKYFRLERPFPVYSRGGKELFDIWSSESPDLKHWGNSKLFLGQESISFAGTKIGPGAPPVKTSKGWLQLFHAVDFDENRGKNGWEEKWQKRYTAGVMLLDLNDPTKILGISQKPLIFPDQEYETSGGWRNDVIFPTGMILEDNGEVKIYYGAADTCFCLATACVEGLINECLN